MPAFSVEVPHSLGQENAQQRLQSLMSKVRERYKDQVSGLEESWSDNVLTFKLSAYSFVFEGTVTVLEDCVRMAGSMPFAAMMFKGKIEQSFRSELEKTLSD
jgi:hypothetical protein